MPKTARQWGPKYSDVDKRKAQRINEWLDSDQPNRISEAELARRADLPRSTAHEVLSGKYASSPTRHLNALEKAIKAAGEAKGLRLPFVETSVYRTVAAVCDRARAYAYTDDVGVVFGRVGVGKTTALKEYARRHPGTLYLRAFDQMTITVLLNRLVWATNAHLEQQARFRAATNADKVDAVIRAVQGTDKMLLIDETTRMHRRCIETLRDIADDAQIGLVLAGREHLEPMVQDEQGRFGEISSRVGFWPPVIKSLEENDCYMIVRAAHDDDLSDAVLDMYWQCCEGSGRALEKLIPSVIRACRRHKCEPTPEIVSNAWTKTMRPQGRRVKR
jgi:DNA transposition AAA+ family ATPase